MLFVIVSIYKPIIHHMDVKTVFLIGEGEFKKKNLYGVTQGLCCPWTIT